MSTPQPTASPTISVALCTHNGAAYLQTQLVSILEQTRPVDEIVVSDDASTDATLEIVRATLASIGSVKVTILHNDPPLGVTVNFEQAIRATTGDIVILCDQDDVWHPNRVAAAVQGLANGALLQFSDASLIDMDGSPLGGSLFAALEIDAQTRAALVDGRAFQTLLKRNLATGATVAFRRELLGEALPIPAAWVHDEWLTIFAAVRESVAVSTEQLIGYRQHGANQIGVVEPTLRRKIARVLQPRGDRNRGLAERSRLLLERLVALQSEPGVIDRARRKVEIETFRAQLPAARIRRVLPVLRRAASGDYQRYCSQGLMDVVRDLLQPA
ncbi:glycosyltransferase family 2 protein [Rathayibacter soli]|uniref:glycosyltransferase family 2 protein n=1 Tax=Rathayibacter soli TaxID=3144168 RepID=UPI0027E47358|nr:glycosyltransferase family 2 protein [Glaciibacter superstes]